MTRNATILLTGLLLAFATTGVVRIIQADINAVKSVKIERLIWRP